MKDFIKEQFLKKHKIDNMSYLDEYINFLTSYKDCGSDYCENHHILPVCTFPEFSKEVWNIVTLKYEDHILSHLLLFKSINIRSYQRPLNWMVSTYKNREEISNAAKNGWVNLKNSKEKYNSFCQKRSDHMKTLSSDEQKRRANIFWENITDEEYIRFSKMMKDYWTDDRRKEKSIQMNEYYSNPENIDKKRVESKNRWDSLEDDVRESFREKMSIINKNEEKRKVASDKIKNLWKDPEYLEKMKNRKKNSGKMIRIVNIDGTEIIVETMKKLSDNYDINPHYIRKYLDKDIGIKEADLKGDKSLLGCKLQSIK